MSELICVPDIGNGEGEVIEILVAVGDHVSAEQSILTVESDKASMEIPVPKGGMIRALRVAIGDKIKTGDPLLELESNEASLLDTTASSSNAAEAPAPAAETITETVPQTNQQQSMPIYVPDIGASGSAKVIEVLIKVGDQISAEQSLITLESDKASMEIPSPCAGIVESIEVQLNSDVKTGDAILTLRTQADSHLPNAHATDSSPAVHNIPVGAAPHVAAEVSAIAALSAAAAQLGVPTRSAAKVHAGPAVRLLAREFGVDLSHVSGRGPKNRVLKEDLQGYVKRRLQQPSQALITTSATGIEPIPTIDFSKFGTVEEVPMSRLQQLAAANLHRSWLNVPHVTQFDQADISELEAFRVAQKNVAEQAGVKLTLLPLLLKACAHLLKEMPDFNSSLAPSGKALIRKHYINIGFAVDTPEGLLVPVIRDVMQKSLLQLAAEAAELADKARRKKLSAEAMQGACFTISSLGHIGGTGFTPIVNAPEVAILGVSKASMQPVWDGASFAPRLMLPLSLSYDHRVINGAAAAQFTRRLGELLGDIRRLLL